MFSEAWKSCKNILCIRLDNMGDVLMSQPAIRALKEGIQGRKATLLTSGAGSSIAPFIPEVDETITFDVPWVKTNEIRGEQQLLALANELRSREFDAAVIFTVYSQNPLPAAMLCYLAGIRKVLGYCRENPYQLIAQWVPDKEPLDYVIHEVERQLRLVGMAGAKTSNTKLLLEIPKEGRQNVSDKISDLLVSSGIRADEPWLVLHAGVSEEKRLYPASDYISACRSLIKQGYRIVLTGSGSERDYVGEISRQLGGVAMNAAGELSIAELIALIAAAPVLVSNNTGPVHIAAAVGTPVVVLYAMTNPQHTPWQVANQVLYFEVPSKLRTKNRLLQSFHGPSTPRASPEGIVAAVTELVSLSGKHLSGATRLTWSAAAGNRVMPSIPSGSGFSGFDEYNICSRHQHENVK
ncbi:lipopolysaccharide heptosyltransferase II [Nitrosospira briensis]|uniref:Lipopolysaccharide heptosyltransferase II n=1 Tax=Nitrosospira briensis TaxID=35799 RepID=A0A1I5BY00_9PROT|nr:glycosyltransferase family 9 protein [Nitrosospira briensis]SFN79540.1 lipopolysaccharide heptosyltransferase II [Nitrosospira briensis]